MSTRSFIGRLQDDGRISGIYCHFDGYPSGVGERLRKHYTTAALVEELVGLGGISSLEDTLQATEDNTYGDSDPVTYETFDQMKKNVWNDMGAEYAYVYTGDSWKTYADLVTVGGVG